MIYCYMCDILSQSVRYTVQNSDVSYCKLVTNNTQGFAFWLPPGADDNEDDNNEFVCAKCWDDYGKFLAIFTRFFIKKSVIRVCSFDTDSESCSFDTDSESPRSECIERTNSYSRRLSLQLLKLT